MIVLKTPEQINIMHEANLIVHAVIDEAEKYIEAGMSTQELNAIMEKKLAGFDATPAFKGYKGYPEISCISINEQVVHGIPSEDKIIMPGDIVSVDFGVYYKGFAGDAARTILVGDVRPEIKELVQKTRQALFLGIEQMVPGNRLHDIGEAIDNVARTHGYGNVREFCGHGIGAKMHESPCVFNYVQPREPNVRLQPGMVLALEPMFNFGTSGVIVLSDEWTVVTKDNECSAHWELSVAITNEGPRILGDARAYKRDL